MDELMETNRIPVLLVDDRQENLVALAALLEDLNLALFTARSGNEALGLSLKHDFALVLMDVRMPDMDGFETAELMRANPKTGSVPIIFITAAMQDVEHQFKGYGAGAFDYLLKPIEPVVLKSKVNVFCDLYRHRRGIELRERKLEALIAERTAELKRAVADLQVSEGRFRKLLESVTGYVYTVAVENGRPGATTHGIGCAAVTGYSTEEYAADPGLWYRMIVEEDRSTVVAAAEKLVREKVPCTIEHRILHKDGSIRWVRSTLVPHIGADGTLLAYDGVITDITDRCKAEDDVRQLNSELERRIKERTTELERRNHELEEMNKAFVGRELRMVELKEQIHELETASMQTERRVTR
jgi:PAS domain S-box-containing protein